MPPFRILYTGTTDSSITLNENNVGQLSDRPVVVEELDELDDLSDLYDSSMVDCLIVEPPIDARTQESVAAFCLRDPTISLLIIADTDTAAEMTDLLSAGAVHVPTTDRTKNERLREELRNVLARSGSGQSANPWQNALMGLSQLFAYPDEADLSASDLLSRAAAIGQSTLGYEVGYGTRVIEDSYTIEAVAGNHSKLKTGMEGKLTDTYCQKTIDTLKTVSIVNAADDSFAEKRMYQKFGLKSYIGAPVVVDGSAYGTLCFADSQQKEATVLNIGTMTVRLLARWVSSQIERNQYKREFTRQTERIEEFAEVVSSDLRNQLNVIKGRNAILDDKYNDRQSELVDTAAEQIASIVDDSLEWVQKGKPITKTTEVDIQTLVNELWYLVADSGTELKAVDAFEVHANWSRLMELFENLIKNMIANNDQEITIRVGEIQHMYTTTRAPSNGPSGFYVECDGRSVPDVDSEKVFQPADVTRMDETGFKLSIVKQIAEAHGWDVTLTESFDDGVRFEFTGVV